MEANELRIGNIIKFNGFENIVTLEDLFNISDGSRLYDSIPLTEEILLKCETRFKGIRHRNEIWIEGECFEFFVNENDFHLEFTGGEGVSFSKPIKYLHQLQNLYFALTNEELTVNL